MIDTKMVREERQTYRQDNIILGHHLSWHFFTAVWTVISTNGQRLVIFGELFNLCSPLVQRDERAND